MKAMSGCGPSSTRDYEGASDTIALVNRLESGRGREPHRVSFAPF
jgi:hypothetical protein